MDPRPSAAPTEPSMAGTDQSATSPSSPLEALGARRTSTARPMRALATRVAGGYAGLAALWIVVSGPVLGGVTGATAVEVGAEVGKGLLFVVVTAAVLWTLLVRLGGAHEQRLVHELQRERDVYERILETSADVVAVFGLDGRIRFVSDAVTDTLGWEVDELIGQPGRAFVGVDDEMSAISFMEQLSERGPAGRRIFRVRHRNGSLRSMEVAGARMVVDGIRMGVIVNGRDVTERVRIEQRLRAALAADVTELPNLDSLVAELELLEPVLDPASRLATIVVDVERFRDVNALFGRVVGDFVLRETARRIEAALPLAIGVWRHSSDEFVAVIPDIERGADLEVRALVEGMREAILAPIAVDETRRLEVDVSVGVGLVRADTADLGEAAIASGEAALERAKAHPDRFALLDTDGDELPVVTQATVVAELREALGRGEIQVHYQPKVRLTDLAVVGAEALVRWEHPTRGVLGPAQFLWAIEAGNLSAQMTSIVVRNAFDFATRWAGGEPERRVSVNLSLDDLRREFLLDEIYGAIDEAGADPSWLCIELTEQTVLDDAERARAIVDHLRSSGVWISIDDFGTGFSSLEHLRLFDVDELKIDRSFVLGLGSQRARSVDVAIVDAMVSLATGLGIHVTAEGVEDVATLERLRAAGCHHAQGYLFGPAVPAADFPAEIHLPPG